jgi:hypothetical protein
MVIWMLKNIACRMEEGAWTLSSLAAGLGISQTSLLLRLELMERLGHVMQVQPCTPPSPPNACSHCSGGCRSGGEENIARYALTEKGRRFCRR